MTSGPLVTIQLTKQTVAGVEQCPTYVVDITDIIAGNPIASALHAFLWTSGLLEQKAVNTTSGNKQYLYLSADKTQSRLVDMSTVTKATWFPTGGGVTNNIYWGAFESANNMLYGTVGADQQLGEDGFPDFNQYVDVGIPGNTGFPHTLGNEVCAPPPSPIGAAACYTDSGGEERQSVYTIIGNPSLSLSYQIMGGMELIHSNGEIDAVLAIDSTTAMAVADGSQVECSCGSMPYNSYFYDWIVRAPPPFIIPRDASLPQNPPEVKNYEIYPTTRVTYDNGGGTPALRLLQHIDSSSQLGTGY